MRKIALLSLTLILISCGATSIKNTGSRSLVEVLTQQADGGANIRFFEILTEEREIAMLENDEKLKNKIHASDTKTSNFIVLNMGKKTTLGSKITVESAQETDKNIIIKISETINEPIDSTSSVYYYPYSVVRINSKKDIIIQ